MKFIQVEKFFDAYIPRKAQRKVLSTIAVNNIGTVTAVYGGGQSGATTNSAEYRSVRFDDDYQIVVNLDMTPLIATGTITLTLQDLVLLDGTLQVLIIDRTTGTAVADDSVAISNGNIVIGLTSANTNDKFITITGVVST